MSLALRSFAVALVLTLTPVAAAETTLRWKLSPGERFDVEVEQQTTSEVKTFGRQATTEIRLGMSLAWEVTGAGDDRFALRQSLRRLQFRMESPTSGRVVYDSAERAQPIGQAREIAQAVAPLLEAELEIVMNDRGDVLEVKPIGEAAQRLFAADGVAAADTGSQPLSRQTVQQLLRQPLAILPDKPVNPGDKWERENELTTALGTATQTTTYTFAGLAEEDEDAARIEVQSKLAITMPPAGERRLDLKRHKQEGTILFSLAKGRLLEAEQTQTLATERPYRETTIAVTLTSGQKTTLRPLVEEADAAAAR
jgi:hypothetical protein